VSRQAGSGLAANVIMLGPPGAGKGTQADLLARSLGLPKISTGDILREAVQAGTELGCIAKATMDAGNLVGDDVMIGIVRERLDREDARRGFILDGFPRTVIQAIALDRIMNGRGPLVVLDIVVPEDELVRRLASRRICSKCGVTAPAAWAGDCEKCGGPLVTRNDDREEIVRERLKVYERQTRPLVEYYSSRPTFRAIDGNLRPDIVTDAVQEAIAAAAAPGGATL
jgi:adenylate kinase